MRRNALDFGGMRGMHGNAEGMQRTCTHDYRSGQPLAPRSLSWTYYVGRSTAFKIIPETCLAIWNALQPTYLPEMTEDSWRRSAVGSFKDGNSPIAVEPWTGSTLGFKLHITLGQTSLITRSSSALFSLHAVTTSINLLGWILDSFPYKNKSPPGVLHTSLRATSIFFHFQTSIRTCPHDRFESSGARGRVRSESSVVRGHVRFESSRSRGLV